jgi:hypothetical protein
MGGGVIDYYNFVFVTTYFHFSCKDGLSEISGHFFFKTIQSDIFE